MRGTEYPRIVLVEVEEGESRTTISLELSDGIWDHLEGLGCNNNAAVQSWLQKVFMKAVATLDKGGYTAVYKRAPGTGAKAPAPVIGDIVTWYADGFRTGCVVEVYRGGSAMVAVGGKTTRVKPGQVYEIVRPG